MTDDLAHQRAETFWTVAELLKQNPDLTEGQIVNLDLEFIPGAAADFDAAQRALKMFGYDAQKTDDGGLTLTVADVAFTGNDIWLHEERTTRIASDRGFVPDGWGFWGG